MRPARGAGTTAIHGWLLLLPAFVLLVAFTHYPAVASLIDSFFSTPRGIASVALGRRSRTTSEMVDDPVFWKALRNNLWFALATIPLSIGAGAGDGAVGQRAHRRARLPAHGLLHAHRAADDRGGQHLAVLLHAAATVCSEQITGVFGLPSHNWLGDQRTALGAVTVVAIWKEAGFFMIFYLAALQSLNPSLREAAAIEGASRWYFFRRVQWPLLMPTTLFVMVNAVINAVRMIDHVVVLTRGGPDNASTLLLYHLYEVGFSFWDTGYAAALTMVLLALLATVALLQFFVLDRRVHYK